MFTAMLSTMREYFAVRVFVIYSSSLKLFYFNTTPVSMNGGYVDMVLPFILKGKKNSQKITLFTVIQLINNES